MSALIALAYVLLVLCGAAFLCARMSSLKGLEALIGGLAGLTLLGALLHLIAPLKILAPPLGIGLLVMSFFWFRAHPPNRRSAIAYLIPLFLFSVLSANAELLYDTGLYHLPHLRILLDQPIQFGIGLLHDRFANATLQPTLLGLFYFPLGEVGPAFLVAAALSVLLLGTLLAELSKPHPGRFYWALSLSLAAFGGILFEAVGSPATDLPAGVLSLFSVLFFFNAVESDGKVGFWGCWLAAGLAVCMKLSQAPVLLVPLTLFFLLRWNDILVLRRPLFWVVPIMLVLMAVSTFLRSGCWAYPASVTCFPKTPFSLTSEEARESTRWVKAWARDSTAKNPDEVLQNYEWVGNWITRLQRANGGFAYVWGILFLSLPALLWFRRRMRVPEIVLIPALLVGLIFWWTQAPELRFAAGTLIVIPAVILSAWMVRTKDSSIRWSRFAMVALLAQLVYLGSRGGAFSFSAVQSAVTQSYPRLPQVRGQTFSIESGESFSAPLEGNQCWDLPAPCMHDPRPYLRRVKRGIWYVWSRDRSGMGD